MTYLSPMTSEDAERVRCWRNSREVLPALRTPFPLTREQQQDWYRTVVCDRNGKARWWSVMTTGDGLVGAAGIENVEWENGRGELSLIIDPDLHGRGYGTTAVSGLLH